MEFHTLFPSELESRHIQQLLLAVVIPRPIGFISTISAGGEPNLAPFSYFQALSAAPPALMFSPNRDRSGRIKHSLRNVREVGEFVANSVSEEMAEAMNYASGEFPDGVSEFKKAGFTPLPSRVVKPFRVAESPVNMECRVIHLHELSDQPLGGTIVVGEIVAFHIREDLFDAENRLLRADRFHPLSRLGGISYAPIRDRFDMPRPKMTPEGEVVPGSHLKKS